MSSSTPSRANNSRKRAAVDPAKHTAPEQRDVRGKLSDFSRYMDDLVAENEESKRELAATKVQLVESAEQLKIAKEAKAEVAAKYIDELRHHVRDYESIIEKLKEEKDELETKMASTETETGELNQLRLTVATVKSHLKDYITLESTGIVLLTTTGQVRWMIIL
jgi:predicted RNase H-like nuclease (RuvC/YqgF family)